MRVVLWLLGIPIALLVLAVILLPLLVDEKALIDLATQKIQEQSGVEIAVDGNASLSVFPELALTTSDVTVTLPEDTGRIEASYLQAGVALIPLLGSRVEMESITIEGVTITTRAADAENAKTAALDTSTLSNVELDAFYAARKEAREAAALEAAAAALAAPMALEVQELTVRDIRARSVDDDGELISELQLKYLTASDLNTAGRAVPLTAQFLLPGETPENPIEVVIEGGVTIDIEANNATLTDISVVVEGATPDRLLLNANGDAALDENVVNLDVQLSMGETRGNGNVRYAAYESPMIDAQLALTELNPALLVLAGPDAAAADAPTENADGDMPLPLHALRMIDTRAKLSIETVIIDAHRLEKVDANLRVVDGVATLEPVSATLHGGAIDFNAVLNGRYNRATISTAGTVQELDAAQALAALDAGLAARGSASLNWQLNGSGGTSEALMQSLQGPIDFTTSDITLIGIGMEQMFCKAVALVHQEQLVTEFPADTAFEALSAKIQLAEGNARLDPLTARMAAVNFSGNGDLDLTSQDLRASFRAQLLPALGEIDPACRIEERIAALRWPLECSGNLAGDPAGWCSVSTGEILRDLAEGEAKKAVQKEAGKLFKKLLGDRSDRDAEEEGDR